MAVRGQQASRLPRAFTVSHSGGGHVRRGPLRHQTAAVDGTVLRASPALGTEAVSKPIAQKPTLAEQAAPLMGACPQGRWLDPLRQPRITSMLAAAALVASLLLVNPEPTLASQITCPIVVRADNSRRLRLHHIADEMLLLFG
jgi:hypothetical protein